MHHRLTAAALGLAALAHLSLAVLVARHGLGGLAFFLGVLGAGEAVLALLALRDAAVETALALEGTVASICLVVGLAAATHIDDSTDGIARFIGWSVVWLAVLSGLPSLPAAVLALVSVLRAPPR